MVWFYRQDRGKCNLRCKDSLSSQGCFINYTLQTPFPFQIRILTCIYFPKAEAKHMFPKIWEKFRRKLKSYLNFKVWMIYFMTYLTFAYMPAWVTRFAFCLFNNWQKFIIQKLVYPISKIFCFALLSNTFFTYRMIRKLIPNATWC